MFKKIILYAVSLLLIFILPCSVNAFETESIVFEDQFSTLNSANWQFYNTNSDISFNNGLVLSSENSKHFPFVYLKNNFIPSVGDYFIEVKYTFTETTDFGVGIGIGNAIPEYGITTQSILDSDFIQFQLWQSKNDGHLLQTNRCPQLAQCDPSRTTLFNYPFTAAEHILRIEYRGNDFSVYIDGQKISSDSLISINRRPTYFWIGNNVKLLTNNDWTDLTIRYIKIGTINNTVDNQPTILIPGLGASWNMGAILSGRDEGEWSIPSFINNYDGLIDSFKNTGYSDIAPNKDLFVFSYDWRRPLDILADRLNDFINTSSSGQKVNLVGHSMGGLVARAYAQKYGTTKVNKIVTIGSPNEGTVKAYGPWEGAMVFDDSWWSKLALELTTHFGVIAGESNIQTVQRIVPSLNDLLPTYEFLIFGNNAPLPISSANKNTYLDGLNSNYSSIDSLTTAVYSDDIETDSLIKVVAHTEGDLSTWIDGKPTDSPFIKAIGDGTVTDFSAKGPFSNVLLGTGWHGELVTKTDNIQNIFNVLGLNPSDVISGVDDSRDRVFVAALRSPGTLEVCDEVINKCNEELGYFDSINKIFILPGFSDENLVVNIREDGIGDYILHLGNIEEKAFWTEVKGNLKVDDQLDIYNVQSNNQTLTATLFDETPPSTPTISGFKNPEYTCGSITNSKYLTVDWTDSTDNYDLAGYEYYVDYPLPSGTGRGVWNPSTLWSKSENYGSLNEGVHYIKVRAKDKSGNISDWSNTCEITYDSIKPSFVSKTIFTNWYTTAQTSSFIYSDANLRSDYIDPSCEISTEGTAQKCSIAPNICDLAGNCNNDPQVSNGANIDMTAPKAPRIFANALGQRIWTGWLPIKDASKYRIYYGTNKNELINVAETRNSYWYSKNLPSGKYFVSVTAVDKAGNESQKSKVVTVIIQKLWWILRR